MPIRPVVLCLLRHEDHYFCQRFYHEHEKYYFFRLPGGGIEHGERAADAVVREMWEELRVQIAEVQLVEIFENIFRYGGETKHEIIFLFSAHLPADSPLTRRRDIQFWDNGFPFQGHWVSRQDILTGKCIIFPLRFRELVLSGTI